MPAGGAPRRTRRPFRHLPPAASRAARAGRATLNRLAGLATRASALLPRAALAALAALGPLAIWARLAALAATLLPRTALAARAALATLAALAGLAALDSALLPRPAYAQPGTSHSPDPTVVFTSPGTKTVTLTVCNPAGCSTTSQRIVVLSPFPSVTSATAAPASVEAGQALLLDAAGQGRPPLTYTWRILPAAGGPPIATLPGPSAAWFSGGAPTGPYTARLTLANAFGQATADRPFRVVPAAPNRFFTIPGCRLLDTRAGGGPLVYPAPPRLLPIAGRCAIPGSARALAVNVTVAQPTAAGFLSLFPGNQPRPLASTLNFSPGATRSNFAVLPLASDGSGTLAAALTLGRPGSVHLILDAAGYFLPTASATSPITPETFQARLCPFGFCLGTTGTPLFFTQSFGGGPGAPPTTYSYDWSGDGAFGPASPVPLTSHTYSAPGVYTPVLRVTSGGSVATLRHPVPLLINPRDPSAVPPAPTGLSARYAGPIASSTLDPTLAGPLSAYLLSLAPSPGTPPGPALLGYNAYISRDGGPSTLAAALDPGLPPGEPLPLLPLGPRDQALLVLTAVSVAGESAPSLPVPLPHP